jgi:hypothetical protein
MPLKKNHDTSGSVPGINRTDSVGRYCPNPHGSSEKPAMGTGLSFAGTPSAYARLVQSDTSECLDGVMSHGCQCSLSQSNNTNICVCHWEPIDIQDA